MRDHGNVPLMTAWRIWGLGALFYLMAFFQRVAPAVMTDALMRDFKIGAAVLGNLSALYFYSYVAMQIPTGIMADLWGPRRLLAAGALVAGIGTLLFGAAQSIWLVGIGRFLIGGSVAVAFVGVLKLSSNWFPPKYYSLAAGMTLLVGIAGAVCAGPPLRILVEGFGWRPVILMSALATFLISAAIWLWVRDTNQPHPMAGGASRPRSEEQQLNFILKGLRRIFRYRNTFLLFIIPGGVVGPVLAFSGLWGVPYLSTHYGISAAQASALTTSLLVAWAVSGPVLGWLSDRIGLRKPIYCFGLATTLVGWAVIVYGRAMPVPVLLAVLLITGFGSGCMILSFALAKESVPEAYAGTATGLVNMGTMLGPMVLQPAIGWMLDRNWAGALQDNVRLYSLEAYRTAFTLLVAWGALSLVLLFFVRETRCRQIA